MKFAFLSALIFSISCSSAPTEFVGEQSQPLCNLASGVGCFYRSFDIHPTGPISGTYHASQFTDAGGQTNFYNAMADYYSEPTTDGNDGILFEPEFLAHAETNSSLVGFASSQYNKILRIDGLTINGRCRATNPGTSGTDHEWYFYSNRDAYDVLGHCNGTSTALYEFFAARPDGTPMQKTDFNTGTHWQWVNFGTNTWSKAQSIVVTVFTTENP